MRGVGRTWFAVILLGIAGVLNVIYGIAALGNSSYFNGETHLFSDNIKTWGWVTLIIGILQLIGALSLTRAGFFGLFIGLTAASLGAIEALLSIGGRYPFWSLGLFALCLWVIHGIVIYGADTRVERELSR